MKLFEPLKPFQLLKIIVLVEIQLPLYMSYYP